MPCPNLSLSLSLGFLCSTAVVLVIIVVVPVPLPLTHHSSTEIGQRDNTNYENDMPCAYDDVPTRSERKRQAESQISLRDPIPVRQSVSSTAAQQQCWTMDGQWTRKITIGCMKSNIVASRLGLGLSRAGEIFARR